MGEVIIDFPLSDAESLRDFPGGQVSSAQKLNDFLPSCSLFILVVLSFPDDRFVLVSFHLSFRISLCTQSQAFGSPSPQTGERKTMLKKLNLSSACFLTGF